MRNKLQMNSKQTSPLALATLTPREWEVFVLLATGKNTSEIAEELHVTTKSVHNNKNRIGSKLQLKGYMALDQFAKDVHPQLSNWFNLIGKKSVQDRLSMMISLIDNDILPKLFNTNKNGTVTDRLPEVVNT